MTSPSSIIKSGFKLFNKLILPKSDAAGYIEELGTPYVCPATIKEYVWGDFCKFRTLLLILDLIPPTALDVKKTIHIKILERKVTHNVLIFI